jgi:polysaccharide biosynthesis protein PslH
MKILFIVPYTPTFIRVRPYQLLQTLLRHGHDVTLATLWESETERAALATLAALGATVVAEPLPRWRALGNSLLALASPDPLQAAYCWQPRLAQRLAHLLQQEAFDIVHVEHLRGSRYGLYVQSLPGQNRLPVIWDSVDCISHLFQQAAQHSRSRKGRLLTRLELGRTQRYESRLVHQFAHVVVTSQIDQNAFATLGRLHGKTPANLCVVPNGVDLAYFAPGEAPRDTATVVFSGKMSYHANITAAIHLVCEIMPLVWAQRPDMQVWLVGAEPTPEVRALQTNGGGQTRQVMVTGTVPDLRPYLQRATIAVAPVPYGAGIQNKVLEAMACGAPVVATSQAAAALQIQPGQDLWLADGAETFAQAILRLLAQPAAQEALRQAGRRYVEQHHSWDAVVGQLEAIYAQATRSH